MHRFPKIDSEQHVAAGFRCWRQTRVDVRHSKPKHKHIQMLLQSVLRLLLLLKFSHHLIIRECDCSVY